MKLEEAITKTIDEFTKNPQKLQEEKVEEIKSSIESSVKLILDEKLPGNPSYNNYKFCDFWDIYEEK